MVAAGESTSGRRAPRGVPSFYTVTAGTRPGNESRRPPRGREPAVRYYRIASEAGPGGPREEGDRFRI